MSNLITRMEVPLTPHAVEKGYGVFVDFPPQYDQYNRQKILTDLEAALAMIFRSFYGDYKLLPQIDGLFIDITRYKHVLDSDATIMYINQRVNDAISNVLEDMNPSIEILYDRITHMVRYVITLYGDTEVIVDNATDNLNATIEINKKKFYE